MIRTVAVLLLLAAPAYATNLESQAYDALVAREGMWVKLGTRYTTSTAGKLVVCGAGYHDSGTDKFGFVYVDGRAVLSTDRSGEYDRLDAQYCRPPRAR